MTHLYTRGSEYGLVALQTMVSEPDRVWKVPEICERADIPEQYTRKVLRMLVEAGILDSSRGPAGGFSLARDPARVSLAEIIEAIDSGPRFDLCILGFKDCDEKNPCALHHLWAPIKTSALRMLDERTLVDLGKKPPASRKKKKKKAARKTSRKKKRASKRRW